MSDDNKPKLGARAPLGIKRTVDVGKVKQSFSHGRTKSVVVEVKRRRVLGRPDGAPEETPVVETAPEAPAPVAASPKPVEAPKPRPAAAPNDLMSRQERQAQLLREAEEARLKTLEDQRRREEAARAEALDAERRRAEEKRREEEAREAAPPAPEPAAAPAPEAAASAAPAPAAKREAAPAADDDNGRGVRRGAPAPVRKEAPKPARGRGDDHRRSGKLTVTRALEGDEDGRARSLAALRRAREKERRAHIGGANQAKQVRDVVVPEAITVQELANRMAEKGADLVKALFKMGSMATINTTIDQDTAELLVTEFGHNIKRVSESDVELGLEGEADNPADLLPRPPVVTIMGHVDHGKTSLLDALRGTDVATGEAGGITQHIGAYQVKVATGDLVTFLDTPGHEAFTEMRGRGANVTDLVVLVVAADDGLKPQSIEAINHTKAAGVPMIVAINKCDKPGAKPQKVREELLQHEIVVEDMGGDVQDVEVSALKKTNLDKLLDAILLQAELLELKANPNRPAEGTVIEAKLDKGRGPVATVLVSRGTVRVGDIFVVGAEWGKVRALVDDRGAQVKEAGPSKPVEVLGLSGTPMAGDAFAVVENEARAREIAAYRASVLQRKRTTQAPANLETMFSALKEKQALEFPLIIKGDVQGSVEAIVAAVNKISTDEIRARVLHSGVGGITESDVTLASASNAPIIGFGVRANAKAREIAEQRGVALKYYDVIYDLVDDVKAAMAGQLGPEKIENVVGRAEIREVFQAGKHGKAAGLLVLEGVIRKALKVRVLRDDVIIYNGAVASLRRFKDDVAEVRAGLECGVTLENTTDIKPGDYLETFEVEERERTL
ncbi:translation initiation factor IF-2 [Sphingosinicella microcystinivorans]|uniref:translation initiation factor IF-2 n=1 Tax=Sphingosinicella microcystinivorans TaxID=335406 RepID=UPI0022F3E3F5|nr:translation initiation factor IF-2 [Sphingosinicella microcystinivorans]WBX84823.1 translation initiation factor IF-2 [Sphingosinicella microcystinivorans]